MYVRYLEQKQEEGRERTHYSSSQTLVWQRKHNGDNHVVQSLRNAWFNGLNQEGNRHSQSCMIDSLPGRGQSAAESTEEGLRGKQVLLDLIHYAYYLEFYLKGKEDH